MRRTVPYKSGISRYQECIQQQQRFHVAQTWHQVVDMKRVCGDALSNQSQGDFQLSCGTKIWFRTCRAISCYMRTGESSVSSFRCGKMYTLGLVRLLKGHGGHVRFFCVADEAFVGAEAGKRNQKWLDRDAKRQKYGLVRSELMGGLYGPTRRASANSRAWRKATTRGGRDPE